VAAYSTGKLLTHADRRVEVNNMLDTGFDRKGNPTPFWTRPPALFTRRIDKAGSENLQWLPTTNSKIR
jgi:hypothetical protein